MDNLVKITPNKEKAKSILRMAETTLNMIEHIDSGKFVSNVTKEYYDVIRELMTAVLFMDGYKVYGEEAHKRLIDYFKEKYSEFTQSELYTLDSLRITRNKIAYDGFFVTEDYLDRRKKEIWSILSKLKDILNKRLK